MTVAGKGCFYCALAALLWGSSGAVGKTLLVQGMSPYDLVQVRVTLASAILGMFLFIRKPALLRMSLKDLPYMFILGAVVMTLVQITYFYAVSKIHVVVAVLLQYTSPVMVAVFAMLFWNERFTYLKAAALVGSIIGCYFTAGAYNVDLLRMNRDGILAGVAAAIMYSCYALMGEKAMHKYSPWTTVFYALFLASVTLNIILEPFKFLREGYSTTQWVMLLYIVIFGSILPFGFYFVGINYIRATKALITATLEPLFAGVFAFLALGESPALPQLFGAALVLGSIILLQIERDHDELAPAFLRKGETS